MGLISLFGLLGEGPELKILSIAKFTIQRIISQIFDTLMFYSMSKFTIFHFWMLFYVSLLFSNIEPFEFNACIFSILFDFQPLTNSILCSSIYLENQLSYKCLLSNTFEIMSARRTAFQIIFKSVLNNMFCNIPVHLIQTLHLVIQMSVGLTPSATNCFIILYSGSTPQIA